MREVKRSQPKSLGWTGKDDACKLSFDAHGWIAQMQSPMGKTLQNGVVVTAQGSLTDPVLRSQVLVSIKSGLPPRKSDGSPIGCQ